MKKHVVLYVDDEPDALQALKLGLEERGYKVLTSDSGEGTLRMLQTSKPDVIIADLRMQPMNGFELFHEVKKLPSFASIPFFFLTAVDDILSRKYGKSLGVDAYITKPVDLDNLDMMIKGKISDE